MCCIGVEGMPASVASTVDVNVDDITSAGVAAERHWGQSSIEVHRAEFHDASSPDQHASGNALPVDAGEPCTSELNASCSITMSSNVNPSQHTTA